MKIRRMMLGLVAAGCAMVMVLPPRASAQANPPAPTPQTTTVSAEDFKKLQDAVQKLSEQVQTLEQANKTQQQTHDDDVQQLKQLKDKLADTQLTVADAEQKSIAAAQAQTQPVPRVPIDEATVNHNFQILGDAEFQFAKADHQHGAFLQSDFAPVFLYRAGDNILFEAGFDFVLQNGAQGPGDGTGGGSSTGVNLSFAQLDYVINDYATLAVGELVLPLGTYSQRTAGWLNKFPDDPLAIDLIPGTGLGPELQGAIPLGKQGAFINYAIYGVNGPSSVDGTGNANALDLGGNVGLTSDGNTANLHGNPVGGARLGLFLPFPHPHYDLEVGLSGLSGEWDNAGNHTYTAGVLDAALHLGSSFELKGEYIKTRYGSDDMGQIRQGGYWVQGAYKLAGLNLNLPVINNLEAVARYDSINTGMGISTQRESFGYVYYFTNTLLFEGDYEFIHSTDPSPQPTSNIIFQLSYGF